MNELQVARYRVLSECLVMLEAMQRVFSRNESMLEPKDGYERPWEESRERCMVVREMLKEVRYEQSVQNDDPQARSE